ncbi:MAG: Beta-lactamase [Acidimicrobiales bacterium]|nr:Beta-lactamase [Acidimicrobiales bacterium]
MAPYERGVHEVADGVFAYLQPDGSWGWSNAGLVVGEGGSLLVDTLFDLAHTRQMLDEMRRITPSIGTVVNTHANGDHCWGNQLLGEARIIASKECADEMGMPDPETLSALIKAAPDMGALGEFLARIFGPFDFEGIEVRRPDQTFEGELTLSVDGKEVRLVEVGPAHTKGDILVHLPAQRVVFTGDILFVGGHPIVWEGPVANWVAALDRILAMDVETVVPGHGPVVGPAAVADERDYLLWLERQATARFEAGMSAQDAARELANEYRHWGDGERIVVNVAAVYRQLDPDRRPSFVDLFAQMADLALRL